MKKLTVLFLMVLLELSTQLSAMHISQQVREMILLCSQDESFRPFIEEKLKTKMLKAIAIQKDFNAVTLKHRENLDWMAFEFVCNHDPRQGARVEEVRNFRSNKILEDLSFNLDRIFIELKMAIVQDKIKCCKVILAVIGENK